MTQAIARQPSRSTSLRAGWTHARRRHAETVAIYGLLTLAAALFLFPIYWLVLSSFKPIVEMFAVPPSWWPRAATLDNYADAFIERGFLRYMLNSLVVATASTTISLTLGALAAYGIARHPFRGSRWLLLTALSLRMVPGIALIVPMFLIASNLQLVDTIQGLILAYVPFQIPLVIWLMHSFFLEIPRELEDAARIDGCSRWNVLLRIALPMAAPGVIVTGILVFVAAWNEFLLGLILTTESAKTMPVALAGLVAGWEVIWGALFAGSVVYMLPLVAISILLQRHIARGFLGGALKE
jgi:multiple sugar transport system permease protein